MKKSLSLLLALAMVFSLFAGVVSAADDTLTTQQKFEALKAKGIFAGKGANQDPALDDDMTRAEGARIIALLAGLDPDSQVVTEQPFPDVAVDAWYAEEVQSVADAGYFVGDDNGNFNPNQKFAVQELAVVIAKVLGLDPVEDAEVDGAASWAAGYIQALLDNGINFPTNYTANATRGQLVEAAYVADQILDPVEPAKVSVVSAKQMNAKSIQVNLDKAVDTEKAKLTVKRNTATLGSSTEWAEDGKSAIVTLGGSIAQDQYTITLSGIDDIAKDSVEFAGEIERIVKLEILTASEILPMADKVQIDFQAVNQFGYQSALSGSNFNINAGGVATPVAVSGKQAFTLNLKTVNKDSKLPITIIHPSSGISTSKVFTVGEPPIVSKVELGDLIYVNNKTRVEPNDKLYVKFTAYDQYGIRVNVNNDKATGSGLNMDYGLATSRGITFVSSDTSVIDKQATPFIDQDGDGNLDLALDVKSPSYLSQDRDITITLYAHGSNQSVSKTIAVVVPKQPATVEFGDTNLQLADGDTNKYLPLILKDKEGNELSTDDVIAAEQTGKLTIYTTNGSVALGDSTGTNTNDNGTAAVIQRTGDDRGKIRIKQVTGKGFGSVVVMITGTTEQASWNFNIADKRLPTTITVSAPAAPKMIHADGTDITENEVKFKIYDQYGEELNKDFNTAADETYKVVLSLNPVGSTTAAATVAGVTYTGTTFDIEQVFDKGFKITSTTTDVGTVELVGKLIKKASGAATTDVEVSSAFSRTEVITGRESGLGLTFDVSIDGAKDDTLYAIFKKKVETTGPVYGENDIDDVPGMTAALQSKSVKITAKDASGNKVELPKNRVDKVTVGNKNVVDTANNKLVGIDAGATSITVAFKTPTGTDIVTKQVTVKGDAIAVDSIVAKNTNKNISRGTLDGLSIFHSSLMQKVTVKDQYGTEYVEEPGATTPVNNISLYNPTLGISFNIKDIEYEDGAGVKDQISIDANGVISYTPGAVNIKKFVAEVYAPNGQKASITVTLF